MIKLVHCQVLNWCLEVTPTRHNPSEEELEYYFRVLQSRIQRFQECMDSEMAEKKRRKRDD
jgi:hypothetical protein